MPRFGGYARGAAVVILSDGLERGDLSALARRGRQARAARLAPELVDAARGRASLRAADRGADRHSPLRRRHGRRRIERRGGYPCAFASAKESRVTGIVDAHHHIWRQADLPWLVGPMQPRIFGPYEPIRRDYPIREYLRRPRRQSASSSRSMSRPIGPKEQFEDETAWVQRTSEETGWPHAIVAYADFSVDDVRPQLDRLNALHAGAWRAHAAALAREPALSLCRARRSVRRSGHPPQRRAAGRLRLEFRSAGVCAADAGRGRPCRSLPEVTFVLQHAGMLEDLSPAGRAAWRAGMARLAACPNIVCKTLRARHLHSSQRPCAHRRYRRRYH